MPVLAESPFKIEVKGEKITLLQNAISPKEWMVIGPFDLGFIDVPETRDQMGPESPFECKIPSGFAKQLPPEWEIKFDKSYSGKKGPVKWQKVNVSNIDEYEVLDFETVFPQEDYAIAYAFTYILAPKACKVTALLGSDDGAKVFLNGKEIFSRHIQRALTPDEDVFNLKLKKGYNQLLIKVEERWGAWGFTFRLQDFPKNIYYTLSQEEK